MSCGDGYTGIHDWRVGQLGVSVAQPAAAEGHYGPVIRSLICASAFGERPHV